MAASRANDRRGRVVTSPVRDHVASAVRLRGARARAWWDGVTFGLRRPGRRILALSILGSISGVGEAVVVLLLVGLVSRDGGRLPALIPTGSTWSLAGMAFAAVVVLAAAHLGAAWIAARAAADAQRTVQLLLLDAFLHASWSAQRAVPPGELQELVMSKARVVVQGTADAARAVSTTANLLIVVAVAIAVDVRATAGLIAVVAFAVIIARPFQARKRRVAVRTVAAVSELATKVAETARIAGDLRIFGVRGRAREDLAGSVDAGARLAQEMQLSATAVPALTRDATLAVLVLALAIIVTAADVSLTVLGATVVLVLRALAHAQTLATIAHRMADHWATLQPIVARLADWGPRVQAARRPCRQIGAVELRDVSVAYAQDGPDALAGASLVVGGGEQLGVVGPTGAGKSTLAAVLLGLLLPREGLVLVDGVPLAEIDPADWHARVAWVRQDPLLLTGTVAENIRFLRSEVDDAAVQRAAEGAVLGADIARWPDGLDASRRSGRHGAVGRTAPAHRAGPRARRDARAGRARRAHERVRRPHGGRRARDARRAARAGDRRGHRAPPLDGQPVRPRRGHAGGADRGARVAARARRDQTRTSGRRSPCRRRARPRAPEAGPRLSVRRPCTRGRRGAPRAPRRAGARARGCAAPTGR